MVKTRWTSQKVEEAYADPSLTMVAWPVTTFTEETLHGLEEQAEAAFNLTCTEVQAGGTIVPAANACFKLVFQQILGLKSLCFWVKRWLFLGVWYVFVSREFLKIKKGYSRLCMVVDGPWVT